jgi:hypothetical protein
MAKCLVEIYAVGDQVEISFIHDHRWFPGQVVALDHPGVWVQAAVPGTDSQQWFVTNVSRIRLSTGTGQKR